MPSCLVPKFYGKDYQKLKEINLWAIYTILMPRQRLESEKTEGVKKTLRRSVFSRKQNSSKSISWLAKRYSLNWKTVKKWKEASKLEDKKCGPKVAKSTVLTPLEEVVVCEFRKKTKLSLDDIYISLINQIPNMTRSNLHRCLQRHGLSVLPKDDVGTKEKKKFKEYTIGYIHIDITEMRVEKQKLYLFVAIDRASKYVFCEIYEEMTKEKSAEFLENLIAECPFKITKILTDNGAQFTYELLANHLKPKDKKHVFDQICETYGIEHRLTKFRHPWTNGQVEITNKMLKNRTVKAFYYENKAQLKKHLESFVTFYNIQKKLKSLKFKSPMDKLQEIYSKEPQLFDKNPLHKTMGLNS